MSMLQCILTTLGTLAALYAIKRIFQYIWVDRVERERLDSADKRIDRLNKDRDEAWADRRKAISDAERLERQLTESVERNDQLAKSLLTQTERINKVLAWLPGPSSARARLILDGQTPKL